MIPEFRTDKGLTRNIDESFKEFIHSVDMCDYFKYVVDHKFFIKNKYDVLNEYYSGNIPDDVIDRFKFDPNYDYILENLNTHSTDLFIRKLKETFVFLRTRIHDKSYDDIRTIKVDILYYPKGKDFILSFIESKQFDNFVKFFGYVLSVVEYKMHYVSLTFEPVDSICVDDLVYGKCHGILYHVTDMYNRESILKSGIRIKKSESGTLNGRKYNERNYFLALYPYCKGYRTDQRILNAIDRYCTGNDKYASIFMVDVNRTNISFYKDTYAKYDVESDDAVYGYTSIPVQCVKWLGDIEKEKFTSDGIS